MNPAIKPFLLLTLCAGLLAATGSAKVDVYTNAELRAMSGKLTAKDARFASQDLEKYPNHYTMLAVRGATGSSELHEHDADVFFVVSGEATLVTGGTVVNPKTLKPGEIRGTSIRGGERRQISAGDVVHIPAGVPHQLLIRGSKPFSYFVVKVSGQ